MTTKQRFGAYLTICLAASACTERAASDATDSSIPAEAGSAVDATGADGAGDGPADAGTAQDGPCPVTGYQPCGGDLLGTWDFLSFCPEDLEAAKALFEHPYDDRPACSDRTENTVDGEIVTTGTLRFEATELTLESTGEMHVVYGFTDACLGAVAAGEPPAEACLAMNKPPRMICVYRADDSPRCSCSATLPADPDNATMPYTHPSETTVAFDGHQASYCVSGDELILDWDPHHPVSWRYWVLRRR